MILRQPGESAKAHAALVDYAALGPGRSLDRLADRYRTETKARPPTTRRATLAAWSTTYHWQDRVAAYDAEQAALSLAEAQAVRLARAREIADAAWDVGMTLIARAQELLARPLIATAVEELTETDPATGRAIRVRVIRETPRGSLRDIATMAKTGVEVARLAAGEPTQHITMGVQLLDAEELDGLGPEQLRAYLAQLEEASRRMRGDTL